MFNETLMETRRQAQICNACRYCEGYCDVFPQLFSKNSIEAGDLTHLANLCHNCRGCYYACQYVEPHQFKLNFPATLAETRYESWKHFAWPGFFARWMDRAGLVIVGCLSFGFALLFWLATFFRPESGQGFYTIMSHSLMITVFIPAFVLPLCAIFISLIRYWQFIGGQRLRMRDIWQAFQDVIRMKNLKGGHGHGCNFEDEDRFTKVRSALHQMTFWGFMMCFASTTSGTVLHYVFGLEAPYSWYSLPKLFGVPGGIMLCLGTAGLAHIKLKADKVLGAAKVWGGEMAFILLLFFVSATGLILYAATGTGAVNWLLPTHLGFVFAFFVTLPYCKMVHGFYRMASLIHSKSNK